jgi:hypothetical protein
MKNSKKIKFCPHPLINTPTVGANFTAISTHFEFPHAHSKSSLSASLVSQSSPEGSQDSVYWRLDRILLLPWNERPLHRSDCAATIDAWKFDGSDRAERIL